MKNLQALFQEVDSLKPDEVRALYYYIVEHHIQFVGQKSTETIQPRVLGLNPGAWMSDDFDAELPDEFWFGKD